MAFHSHVYNRADHDERYPLGLPWCHEAGVEQHFFATETEACAAQRDYRRWNGRDPETGEVPDLVGQRMRVKHDHSLVGRVSEHGRGYITIQVHDTNPITRTSDAFEPAPPDPLVEALRLVCELAEGNVADARDDGREEHDRQCAALDLVTKHLEELS